jgi:hypothetical protein
LADMRVLGVLAVERVVAEMAAEMAVTACDVDFALRCLPDKSHEGCKH